MSTTTNKPSAFETRKESSNYLRGSIKDSLGDPLTGALREEDQFLIKFHGSYQQQDRDLDEERQKQKLEPLYSFLIRVRVPGGIATAAQWLEMDRLAEVYGDNTLKLTTRQAFQLHGVLKRNLKPTIAQINQSLLDTLAACGDVNRNVMSSANPFESDIHAEMAKDAALVSAHLSPQTGAYHEIWLNDELVAGGEPNTSSETVAGGDRTAGSDSNASGEKGDAVEPLYGKVYLPRKFKIAFVLPPQNDTDVLTNDLGFIAIVENGQLIGYNLTVGGGMAMTFGEKETYPRIADVVGFFPKEKLIDAAEAVLVFQRDHGNRSNRRNARLKYTIDRLGLDFFQAEIKRTHHLVLESVKPYEFTSTGDPIGWKKGKDGLWHCGVFVEGGKLKDQQKAALREIAAIHEGTFILTGNQNVLVAQVSSKKKPVIDSILKQYGLETGANLSQLRQHSIACAALPLCGLAFAEAERYLPSLIDKIDSILEKYQLRETPIVIRMTGCPNGCGRPFMAEIGFVGRAPGLYNLYLGGGHTGQRLNKLYKEMCTEAQILELLDPILADYARDRKQKEPFGDFILRKAYV